MQKNQSMFSTQPFELLLKLPLLFYDKRHIAEEFGEFDCDIAEFGKLSRLDLSDIDCFIVVFDDIESEVQPAF